MAKLDLANKLSDSGNVQSRTSPTLDRDFDKEIEHGYLTFGWLKRLIDIIVAVLALAILSPMLVMVAFALYLTQGSGILISHRRIGKNGVIFPCLKLRTMCKDGDEVLAQHLATHPVDLAEWNATRKLRNDPRVTFIGKTLRKNSIDEIPQLLNVIRGEMSLVGPRPITPNETSFYGRYIHEYMAVRPGLTGLWQVSGRSETTYRQRVELDVKYVTQHSIWGDIVIMAKTIPAVLSSRGSY
ncbi:sugar transferase [Rhizobium tumorigenes]|uniref:sugar transferase n=1 Tax=Rhizobium tumorigenes TaxID=2041385 RepID=UPI00241F811C|nr:sugar transferase [Rhizobium tumorigenes]WFS03319.1 sugar transferase [Rhizobium tumorigenes]